MAEFLVEIQSARESFDFHIRVVVDVGVSRDGSEWVVAIRSAEAFGLAIPPEGLTEAEREDAEECGRALYERREKLLGEHRPRGAA